MIGLGLSLWNAALQRQGSFNPLSLDPVVWLDFSDLTTLFQERTGAAATTPSVVDGVVGTIRSKGNGGVNYFTALTDAARAILRFVGGKYYLQFDGIDDAYICDDAFPATTYIAGAIMSSGATWNKYGGLLDARVALPTNRIGAMTANTLTGLWTNTVAASATRQNGVSKTVSTSCWTSINTKFIFDIVTAIGKTGEGFGRNLGPYDQTTNSMPSCNLYQIMAFTSEPSTADRLKLEAWLAEKAGVTL